jgi:hypothetical protein
MFYPLFRAAFARRRTPKPVDPKTRSKPPMEKIE